MIRLLIGIFFIFCGTFQLVAAQGSAEFNIRLFGAEDTEAPASTTISSVLPISASQIDVSWATTTDNYTVFGYVVFRDGTAIATTTAVSYSDTGLIASTTYSYTVRAFDSVPNYSSSSNAVATTTLDIPPPVATSTPTTTTSSGTITKVVLGRFSVEAATTAAKVSLETVHPSRIEIRFGKTATYELGYVVGNTYARSHVIPVNDLQPNTTYYYEVVGYTTNGRQTILRSGSFTTRSDTPPPAPTNVSNFSAVAVAQSVDLEWDVPADFPQNGVVRIVRSHYGYPLFINDGVVVYEGQGDVAQDIGVLGSYDRVFYTAFVIDPSGLTSSGAIALVSVRRSVSASGQQGVQDSTRGDELVPDIELPPVPFNPDMPTKGFIVVEQDNRTYTFASSSIPLSATGVFSVSIAAEAIRGDFKTVIATLADPRGSGKSFSFLLRLNAERTAYVAMIAPVHVNGAADLTIEIYDYDALVMARYTTQVVFSGAAQTASSTLETLLYKLSSWLWASLLAVPFIVLLILWLVFKRRDEAE